MWIARAGLLAVFACTSHLYTPWPGVRVSLRGAQLNDCRRFILFIFLMMIILHRCVSSDQVSFFLGIRPLSCDESRIGASLQHSLLPCDPLLFQFPLRRG